MTRTTTKRKRTKSLTLREYAKRYLAERETSEIYQYQIRMRIDKFCKWAGKELLVKEIDCELVNKYLAYLGTTKLKPHTVQAYRENIRAVWQAAFMDELNDNPPLRLRRIKKPRLIVECYTHDEIKQLLAEAAKMKGIDANGNRRRDFWQALIHAAYSTGLRRGDLLAVPKTSIAADGAYTTIQKKTGYRILVKFSPEALKFANKLRSDRGLLLDWPHRLDSLVWSFRRLRNRAGIKRGSLKWIRRSAGSYAEAAQPGTGAKMLGHRHEAVFRAHYEDMGITAPAPMQAPAMGN